MNSMDTVHSPLRMPVIEGVATHCRYQEPGSTMTLAEGLAEYYATNDNLFKPEQLATDPNLGTLARFFAAHDACHVLFGLDTSLADETLADSWTLFGTDVTFRELWAYARSEGQKEFFMGFIRDLGYWKLIKSSLAALPRVAKAFWYSRRMPHKWSLYRWEDHLDVPLDELRQRYRIQLV